MADKQWTSTKRRPAEERFWEKVNAEGVCWEWDGARIYSGYGKFAPTRANLMYAHRFAWELLIGPIPDGMTLDHRCRNRCCVNPDHLEIITGGDNTLRGWSPAGRNARKTHCAHGHEFTPDNTYHYANGGRKCRTCDRDNHRRYAQRTA